VYRLQSFGRRFFCLQALDFIGRFSGSGHGITLPWPNRRSSLTRALTYANFLATLYLHHLAAVNDYLYRAIFDIGDREQNPLFDIHRYLFANLFRSCLSFFQTGGFRYRYHSFSQSEQCGHEQKLPVVPYN
jgi:hypothetical protein